MKKTYIVPAIEAYKVNSNNIIMSSLEVKEDATSGSDGWGVAQSKILSGDISDLGLDLDLDLDLDLTE